MALDENTLSENPKDNDRDSWVLSSLGKVCRRVCDDVAHAKLDSIIGLLGGSTTPAIANIITTASTEASYTFTAGTKSFRLRTRGNSKLQYSYTTGLTDTTFMTLMPTAVLEETQLSFGATIYFETTKNDVVEILEWT